MCKYIIGIVPSLGLLQCGNLQRVCVSPVMALARGCPISQECLFALVKLPLDTVISPFTAAVGVIKGKLVGVPDPRGTQGTREVPLGLYHQRGGSSVIISRGMPWDFSLCLYT